MKTNVYIDGFNLYAGAVKGTAYKWLNLLALSQTLIPGSSINRIRYFTARIKGRAPNPDAPVRQALYLRALRSIPNLDIIEGRFSEHPQWCPAYPYEYSEGRAAEPRKVRVMRSEEKGTDVNIAAYLLADCFKDDYEQAALISNDSDFALAVRMVRDDFNKPIIVVNPVRKAGRGVAALERASTRMIHRINPSHLRDSQFPDRMTDSKGTFSKPRGW